MAINAENRRRELYGTAAAIAAENPVLLEGEWCVEIDQVPIKAKLGDGDTAYNSLPYFGSAGTLEGVIAADPIATSVPEFQGGANVGNGTSALMFLKDGLVDSTLIAASAGGLQIKHSVGVVALSPYLLLNTSYVDVMSSTEWNASTNTPTLDNTDTNAGNTHYRVSVAGTHDFGAGSITFGVNDIVGNLNGEYYKKVDNNQAGSPITDYVSNDTTGEPSGSDSVIKMVSLTQAEYDAGTPNATTFYVITDA